MLRARYLLPTLLKLSPLPLLNTLSYATGCAEVDKAPLVAKITQEVGKWCGMQLSVEEGNQLGDCSYLWRSFVTIAQMTPLHAHTWIVTCLERPWGSWSIRTSKLSFSSVNFILFHLLLVTHFSTTFPYVMNFENGVLRNGQQQWCAERACHDLWRR